jgi:hypothetical protein
MQLMGAKHYPVRMFSDGMDDFVMNEKTLKTTPEVAGLQIVAVITRSRMISSLSFRRVVNVVQFLLGSSPASVCYWPTFRTQ